jgi:group I intron endonuclease
MEERIYKVYMHTNMTNGKKYIGITRQELNKRWKSGNGYNGTYFANAIQKYGWDRFKHEAMLQNLTKEEAEMFEVEMIKYYKTTDRSFGYNIANGGNGIGVHTEETKLKIGKANTGKKRSKEFVENQKNRMKLNNPNIGRKHTNDARKKIGKAHKGRRHSDEHNKNLGAAHKKPVQNIETGEVFKSATDAGKRYGVGNDTVWRACNGKNKTAAGYRWKYFNS